MKRLLTLALLIGLSATAALSAGSAHAVTSGAQNSNTGGQALEIAPPVLSITADPGQTIRPEISLRNVSNGRLLVTGQVDDFAAAGEDGTPKIILDDTDNDNPYSIKTWVRPLARQTLEPRRVFKLPVTIAVPANAAPGGYFGVIRFTATPPELEGTGVSLSASLGALVLIRVSGAATEGLNIEEFSASANGKKGGVFEGAPITFTQRLKNTGNVFLQPAGQVTVKDMFGNTIGVTNINLPPRNILPNSIRKFDQSFDKSVLGNKILFGRYTATLKVTYGDSKKTATETVSFWVIPYTLILVGVIGLVVAFLALRFLIRRYNRAIIRKAQGQKRSRRK